MTPATGGALAQEGMLPYVVLPKGGGGQLDLWQYKGRRNLVLFLGHGTSCDDCKRYLAALAERYHDFQEWETEIVAVIPGNSEDVMNLSCELNLPFPMAVDQAGVASSKLGLASKEESHVPQAGTIIADRWGEIYETSRAHGGHQFPSVDAMLDTLHFIEIQCPECGVGG